MGVNKKNKMAKFFKRLSIVLIIIGAIYVLDYLYQETEIFDYLFYRIFEQGNHSTFLESTGRQDLSEAMINDFNNHPFDWLIGRGPNGTYVLNDPDLSINGRRFFLEVGFLFMILKGGLIYLILNTYLLLHAAYKGFRKSKNVLCKSMAFLCIWQVLCLVIGESEPHMCVRFALVWVCFGLLENKNFRYLDDNTIYSFFNHKYYKH